MNILYINHYAGSPEMGMEFRPYYLSKEWVKQGHVVYIVSGSFSHLRKQQPKVLKDGTIENIDGIKYYWLKTPYYRSSGIKRFWSMIVFVMKLFKYRKKITNLVHPDIVIASSTYPLDIYPAHSIAKRIKATLCFELHDLWPLSPMEIGGYSKWHPFIVIMQHAENYSYKYCDKCISILPCVKEHVIKHGLDEKKLSIVTNGFDSDEWESIEELSLDYKNFFNDLHLKKKKILGYVGGVSASNALRLLIDSLHLIKDETIVCVLIGDGNEKKDLMNYASNLRLNNLFFLESVPKKMIPALLKEMDVLYLGGKNHSLYRYGTSQTKLFDYFQAAKPVIQTISPPNNYIEIARSGITIKESNPKTIAKAIISIMSLSDTELSEMGQRGKVFCDENFSYKKLSVDFLNACLINREQLSVSK